MSDISFHQLELKKQSLRRRSADLRRAIALQSDQALGPVFSAADRVNAGRHWLARHPEVMVGVALLVFRRRTKGWLAWGRRAVWLWSAWRQVQPLLGGKART